LNNFEKIFKKKFPQNSEFQVAMAGQKFSDSIGNGQGNNPEMALPCHQISSNESTHSMETLYFGLLTLFAHI